MAVQFVFSAIRKWTCLDVKKPTAMFHPVSSDPCQHQPHSPQVSPLISPSLCPLFNCLPILHTDVRVPLLSNVIKISGRESLSVSSSRKWERKPGSGASPPLAVTSHLMSTGASHPILNESLLSGLAGDGGGVGAGLVFLDIGGR